MTPLRQRVLNEMKLRNYFPWTVEAYLTAIIKLNKNDKAVWTSPRCSV